MAKREKYPKDHQGGKHHGKGSHEAHHDMNSHADNRDGDMGVFGHSLAPKGSYEYGGHDHHLGCNQEGKG